MPADSPADPSDPSTPARPVLSYAAWGRWRRRPKQAPAWPVGSYRLTRQIFVRGIGLIYLIAILSLWVQIDGLIGSHGILPIGRYFDLIHRRFPHDFFWHFPTLCWLSTSDGFLHFLCGAGVALSLAVIAGFFQAPALAALWAIYLSLTVAGLDFLEFQWDLLLLEAGFLAIFFAPLQMLPRVSRQPEPSHVVLWLVRWLLFRLMFLSGLVKLLSGDPSWRNGTAMNYHYLTQPLPTWTSYWVYWLPHWMQWISVWSMFGIELVAPFLIFAGIFRRPLFRGFCASLLALGVAFVCLPAWVRWVEGLGETGWVGVLLWASCVAPVVLAGLLWVVVFSFSDRRLRQIAFTAIVFLQVLITATGNFGFFNLLSILLCVPLLDDAVWPRRLRVWLRLDHPKSPPPTTPSAAEPPAPAATPAVPVLPEPSRLRWPLAVTVPLAVVVVILTTLAGLRRAHQVESLPTSLEKLMAWAEPFRSANGYGLFEVMTKVRHEIVIEGSDDGVTWREYEFKYKPGDVFRRPGFCTPHMPRLDWQMWFAALGDPEEPGNRWFLYFLVALLRGDERVLALMGNNPFPHAPPHYIRARFYDYTYAPPGASGQWWQRQLLGDYVRPITLDEFRQIGLAD